MSHNYKIEYLNGITRVHFSKRPTYSELKEVIDDIAENYPYEKRLWNLSNLDFHLTVSEIDRIAEYGKQKFIKPNKMAVVAAENSVYGEMRIFEALRKQINYSNARVFRQESEAIEWLNKV